jgi:hypothetical protein
MTFYLVLYTDEDGDWAIWEDYAYFSKEHAAKLQVESLEDEYKNMPDMKFKTTSIKLEEIEALKKELISSYDFIKTKFPDSF